MSEVKQIVTRIMVDYKKLPLFSVLIAVKEYFKEAASAWLLCLGFGLGFFLWRSCNEIRCLGRFLIEMQSLTLLQFKASG